MPSKTDPVVNSSGTWTYRKEQIPVINCQGGWRCGYTPTVTTGSGSYTVRWKSRGRSWDNTPGWPNVPKPLATKWYKDTIKYWMASSSSWDRNNGGVQGCKSGTCYMAESGVLYGCDGIFAGALNVSPVVNNADVSFTKSRAILAALNDAGDQKANLLVSAAEMQKSIDMVTERLRRLIEMRKRFLKELFEKRARRGIRRKPSREELHKAWLEYRYGWRPLLFEMRGIAEFINERNLDIKCARYNGRFNLEVEAPDTEQYWNAYSWKGYVTVSSSRRTRAKCAGYVCVENTRARQLAQLGLTNPMELLWEVLPYSFVVDWVVQVGDYIKASNAGFGVTWRGGFLSTLVVSKDRRDLVRETYPKPNTIYRGKLFQLAEAREYERLPYVPSILDVDVAHLVNIQINWKRWADALALLRNLFR